MMIIIPYLVFLILLEVVSTSLIIGGLILAVGFTSVACVYT